ncbi:MAG: reductive dehalogenase [Chloroflexi bacterium]|nr:reductive dehalogenase [Chloroflexota bacterium]
MKEQKKYSDVLSGKKQLGHYPMEKLKHVSQPTTKITGNVQRFDEREQGFVKADRGDFGDIKRKDQSVRAKKDPLFSLFNLMISGLPPVDYGVSVTPPPRMNVGDAAKLASILNNEAFLTKHPILEVASDKMSLPADIMVRSRHIKSAGYFLGADVMGVCELPQYALYSHNQYGQVVESNDNYAICIVVDQDYRTTNGSTLRDWIGGSPPQWSYLSSAFIATMLAGYIRKLGYHARVQHAQNYQVLITPLLLLSGIGEMSRAGIVLNPFIGMRFKAAVVTTDLPLEPDKPVDFGLQDFCDKCKKCARECPSKAISTGDKIMHNGYETWPFHYERCTKMRVGNPNGMGCGACIKACPWNKSEGWTHDLVRWMIKYTPFMNRAIVKMDDIMGYGKPDFGDRWQFDF